MLSFIYHQIAGSYIRHVKYILVHVQCGVLRTAACAIQIVLRYGRYHLEYCCCAPCRIPSRCRKVYTSGTNKSQFPVLIVQYLPVSYEMFYCK